MIQFATNEMKEALMDIWEQCFGDSKQYIAQFFGSFDLSKTVLVYCNGENNPVSMLALLPAFYTKDGSKCEATYIYGVATKEAHQGRGYSSKLLEYARKMIENRNGVAFLSPASASLIKFYEKQGFTSVQKKEISTITKNEIQNIIGVPFEKIEVEEYKRLRKNLSSDHYLQWEDSVLKYAIKEAEYYHGGIGKVTLNEEEIGVLYRLVSGELELLEITSSKKEVVDQIHIEGIHFFENVQRVVLAQKIEVMATEKVKCDGLEFHLAMG